MSSFHHCQIIIEFNRMTPVNTQVITLPLHTCSLHTHTTPYISPVQAARSHLLQCSPPFSPRCPGGQGKQAPSLGCQPASLPKSQVALAWQTKGWPRCEETYQAGPVCWRYVSSALLPLRHCHCSSFQRRPTPRKVARATKVLHVWPPHMQCLAGQLLPGRMEKS